MSYLRRWRQKVSILLCLTTSVIVILAGCTSKNAIYKIDNNERKEKDMIKNHITLPEKTRDGAADPFIMRYNGWYYLYTTGAVNIWRSKDLANWEYVGTANESKPLSGAFAPEVYYWNGKFYMYTSPLGNGHYILEADEPTGPFNYATDNLGLTIDGSIFIEDDGTWYFTRASGEGIMGHEMSSPIEIDPIGKNLRSSYMGHWTEGSMIIKRDGRYFMTYTGNHFESKGYRINYSVSEEDPFGKYERPSHNPILINDIDESHALGHSSFVYGPDLDSMYIAYHSYVTGISPRVLNIDRLSFNGTRMYANGPTWFDTPVADLPDFALWPEDNPASQMESISLDGYEALISKEKTSSNFTAEWNLSGGDEDTGIVLCKDDGDNHIRMIWHKDVGQVTVDRYSEGAVENLGKFELPEGFTDKALHSIKVQYSPQQLDLYFDGMHKLSYKNPGLDYGYIGYLYTGTEPTIGFTGFSHVYKGAGDNDAIKPIPGKFDAVHHILGEEKGFGGNVSTGELPGDVKTLILEGKGAWASYTINVEKDANYGIALEVRSNELANEKIKVLQDGESIGVLDFRKVDTSHLEKNEEEFVKLPLGNIHLKSGISQLSIQLAGGKNLEILEVELYKVQDDEIEVEFDLTKRDREMMIQGGGNFSFTKKGMANSKRSDIKMTTGDKGWTDYRVNVDVTPGHFAMGNSGIIFRATNESYHPHQNVNAMQGYYAGMDGKNIFLKRMNYEDTKIVEKVPFEALEGNTYSIGIEAKGNIIKVFVDDNPEPIISYFDPQPFLFGRAGIWSFKDEPIYSNLRISSLK